MDPLQPSDSFLEVALRDSLGMGEVIPVHGVCPAQTTEPHSNSLGQSFGLAQTQSV